MYTLPELPYPTNALEPHIDAETMSIHHDKHHATYVTNLNKALENEVELSAMSVDDLIQNLNKVPEKIRVAVRNNAGGHANHSLFWTLMSAQGGSPSEQILKELTDNFGSFDSFKETFSATGLGRFGSGWVWLIRDNGKLNILSTPNQDSPLMDGRFPLLGCDVWEHAYYLKYQNRRADYLQAWWNVVNWNEVEKRWSV